MPRPSLRHTDAATPADTVRAALLALARLLGRLAAREAMRPAAEAPDGNGER